MRLEWTNSGYRFVDDGLESLIIVNDGKQIPNKTAKRPEVEFTGDIPPTTEYHHRGLPIPLVSLPFILFCVFALGLGLGMGIA